LNKALKVDTKSHIKDTARRLFNETSFGATTSAAIAAAAGKTEGNIWYHFKSKRDIFDALCEELIERIEIRKSLRPAYGGNIMSEYANLLHVFVDELRDFRFLYRDQADYGKHSDHLLKSLPKIYEETLTQFRIFFDVMIKEKILADEPDQIETLLQASIIAIRYHLEIWREMGKSNSPGSGAVHEAFELHIKLFEHLLTPEAVEILRRELLD